MKHLVLITLILAASWSSSLTAQSVIFCRVVYGFANCYYYSYESCSQGGKYYCYAKEQ
jgi:hypothetical protein